MIKLNFCCDRCKDRVQLPANASYDERICRKCGARYQREEADTNLQPTNNYSFVNMKKVLYLLLALGVFGGVGTVAYFYINGNEYSTPTIKQKANAAKAIEVIDILEKESETNYFDPEFHAILGVVYARAFAGHTDNATYLERAISELVVSLGIKEDQKALSFLQRIYADLHTKRTPENIYTPTSLSFQLWYQGARIDSPHPEDVRLILSAENDLGTSTK